MSLSIVDLLAKEMPPEDWIVEGFLTRGNTGFIIGPAKKGKSWLLLDMAWDLSEGKYVWGIEALRPPRPLRVVYFTQEDTERNIRDRIELKVKGGRVANDRIWIEPKNLNIRLDTPEGRGLLKRSLDKAAAREPIDLVMLDPMRRIHGGEENDSKVIADLWHVIEGIHNDYGCSTLIAHHITKPPNDREHYDPADPYHGRGSGDIYGGGDAFVMLVPGAMAPDGKSWRRCVLHFESKRAEPMPPAELKIGLTTGKIEYVGKG